MKLTPLIALSLAVLAVLVVSAVMFSRTDETDRLTAGVDPRWTELRDEAIAIQAEENWCAAADRWQELVDSLPESTAFAQLREEADSGLLQTKELCAPTKLVSEVQISDPSADIREANAEPDDIAAIYPKGKRVHSSANCNVSGRGTNKHWVFNGEASFIYQYRVEVISEVVESGTDLIRFRQKFVDVSQLRLTSEKSLQFHFPESPVLEYAWESIDRKLTTMHPNYRILKALIRAGNMLDPNGKKTLTRIQKQLETFGISNDFIDPDNVVSKIDKLEGLELEFDYRPGFGITYVKVLHDTTLEEYELIRLARSSSLLMDYFISTADKKEPGESFSISSRDIAGFIPFGINAELDGNLTFRRENDVEFSDIPELLLSSDGGTVIVSTSSEGFKRTGEAKPLAGNVQYSREQKLVREANGKWDVNLAHLSQNHLLFGTERVRELEVQTLYHANVADQP